VTLEVRVLADDELPASVDVVRSALLAEPGPLQAFDAERSGHESGRTHGALEDGRLVGTAGAFTFDLTVPGGCRVPAAGVTRVGVLATHTRRGALTTLMRAQLRDVRQRGEPVAVLRASEAAIYGRFGYGAASRVASRELRRERGRLRADAPAGGTQLHFVDRATAAEELPRRYDEVVRRRPGTVSRPPWFWRRHLALDRPEGEGRPTYFVVADGGYAWYSVADPGNWGPEGKTAVVHELEAADSATEADLWRHVLSVDLVGPLRLPERPVDDLLLWLLDNPRHLRTTAELDDLWVRLVDVSAALAVRRYDGEGRVLLEVDDPFLPEQGGTFELVVAGGEARCTRVEAPADLALGTAALAAAYLGGVRLVRLADAGLVVERAPGALLRGDALFATARAPWCGTMF
jgi:predicted acetyltransferase